MFFLLKSFTVIEMLMAIGLLTFRWALAPQYKGVVSAKIVVLALLTPAVALFCGNIYMFCAYLVAAVAFNSRSRAELAGNYVFLLPLMPFLAVETGIGSIYLLAISAVIAMNLGALIGFAISRSGKSLTQPRFDLSVLLLIGLFIFIYGRDASATGLLRGFTINVLGFGAPYLLVSRGLSTRKDIEWLLLRLSLGAFVMAVTACFQSFKHWVVFESYYQAMHVAFPISSATLALRAGMLRTGGSMVDYSSAGLFLAAVLSLMPFLRPRFRPFGFWVIVAITIAGLIATQSRGAWIAAIVGLLFVAAYRKLWWRAALLAASSSIAFLLAQLYATSGRLAAIAGRTDEASRNVSYRKQLLSRGLEQVQAHPLLGQAPDQLIANLPDLIQGQHIVDFVNAHLYVAMVAGVPLFLVWCYVWISPVIAAWGWRRVVSADLAEAPAAIIVPVLVAIGATAITERNLIWPTIALGLAGPCFALSRQRRAMREHAGPTSKFALTSLEPIPAAGI